MNVLDVCGEGTVLAQLVAGRFQTVLRCGVRLARHFLSHEYAVFAEARMLQMGREIRELG